MIYIEGVYTIHYGNKILVKKNTLTKKLRTYLLKSLRSNGSASYQLNTLLVGNSDIRPATEDDTALNNQIYSTTTTFKNNPTDNDNFLTLSASFSLPESSSVYNIRELGIKSNTNELVSHIVLDPSEQIEVGGGTPLVVEWTIRIYLNETKSSSNQSKGVC